MINPVKESYMPEVIENNVYEEGIILSASFNPHDYSFVSPIFLKPGTAAKVGMKAQVYVHEKPKYHIFPRTCDEDGELKLLRG